MECKEKLELLEDAFDMEAGSLKPDMVLANTEGWDSMAKLSLIVLMEDEFGKKLAGDDIRALVTVQDILNHME